jgi:hypothetical protein
VVDRKSTRERGEDRRDAARTQENAGERLDLHVRRYSSVAAVLTRGSDGAWDTHVVTEPAPIKMITDDLIDVRQRGVDRLDVDTPQQPRKEVKNLERLAREYCEAEDITTEGRIDQITRLLQADLLAYRERENQASANFIEALLFDPSSQTVPQLPSKRLDSAMKVYAKPNEIFDNVRRPLFAAFARFLVGFVANAKAHGVEAAAKEVVVAKLEDSQAKRSRPSHLAVLIGIPLLVLGIGSVVWLRIGTSHTAVDRPNDPLQPSAHNSATAQPAQVPGRTYTEQAGNRNGASTWNNPYTPSVTNQKIPFLQKVEVSCKVYAPSFPNVSPDGYWYRERYSKHLNK